MRVAVPVAIEFRALKHVLLSLGIGSAGGYLFYRWHMPLPWMLGSMIFVSTSALMGAPVRRYMPLRNVMIIVLGILVGSFFTAEVFRQLIAWSGAALIMLGYVAVTTLISLAVFRRIAFMDRTTAYFSSTPGGLGVMVIAGEQAGGDTQQMPIAHATRVFLVVLCVPLYFAPCSRFRNRLSRCPGNLDSSSLLRIGVPDRGPNRSGLQSILSSVNTVRIRLCTGMGTDAVTGTRDHRCPDRDWFCDRYPVSRYASGSDVPPVNRRLYRNHHHAGNRRWPG